MFRLTRLLSVFAIAFGLSAACEMSHTRTVIGPTPNPDANVPSLIGTWTASGAGGGIGAVPKEVTSSSGCTNVQWQVTSQTGSTASGPFSMTCGDMSLAGTATGEINGSIVTLSLTGTATLPTGPCTFTVSGTGTLTGDSLTIPYSGTTCLGPISGTEVLRRKTTAPPTPEPEPEAPKPPDPPKAPEPPSSPASDHLNITNVPMLNSPFDLASWPITTALTTVDVRPSGIRVEFSKKDGPGRWPDITPPGWDGPLQYTLGMCLNINGKWYCSAVVEYWYGLEESGGEPWNYAINWFYDAIRWAPMTGHQPAPGETIGFFVCAGDCRNNTKGDLSPVKERTNVVLLPMPGNGGAIYRF